ncbi:hypothetical protein [Pelagibaculum spongiae]|nr:hypothetical protein [Pelagibaculum spongiae]
MRRACRNCGMVVKLLYLDEMRDVDQVNRDQDGGLIWSCEHAWPKP